MSPLEDEENNDWDRKFYMLERKIDGLLVLTLSCWVTYLSFRFFER